MSSRCVKIDGLTLATGNAKLGRVMNISLPPPVSCDTSMPCFVSGQCYAMRHCYRLYGNVRESWNGNWNTWLDRGPAGYFGAIRKAIALKRPRMFRWHVGGDIPESGGDLGGAYIGGMCSVADAFPDTAFWCFTKRYGFIRANSTMIRGTPNLNVVLSAWPGVRLDGRTRLRWPVCWVRDPLHRDFRIPKNAHPCAGDCEKCQVCAFLKPGESIVIRKH